MKNILILILLIFTLSSCVYKKELYSWNYKRIKEKIKFKINKKEKIYMNLSILKMKQILTILITILLFSSCEDKPIIYHNYEITYWDNTKDTLYQIYPYMPNLNPYEGCIKYYDNTGVYTTICYVKSTKLIK